MTNPRFSFVLLPLLLMITASASATTAQLMDGTIIDMGSPGGKVYVVSPDGDRSPLWNGVFQLSNGGVLTIRDGVMTSEPWTQQGTIPTQGLCQKLVDKVCGVHGNCSDTISCKLARQMADMETSDDVAAATPSQAQSQALSASAQCETALNDEAYFKPCQ